MNKKIPEDIYWRQAVEAFGELVPDGATALCSGGMEDYLNGALPLEISWAKPVGGWFFCASKDDVHRIAPWCFLESTYACHWANEVFVLGSVGLTFTPGSPLPFDQSHLIAWNHLIAARQLGCATHQVHGLSWVPETQAAVRLASQLKVLVVGASSMGNVGDDLLAGELRDLLLRVGHCRIAFANPDIDPLLCQEFDVVIAGPGGILYASRDSQREYTNLVNYLKFAFVAEHSKAVFWLVGVGDQQTPEIGALPPAVQLFWRGALSRCGLGIARDSETWHVLRAAGVNKPVLAQDLVFGLQAQALAVPRPVHCGAIRIALCGEWYTYPQLEALSDLFASAASQDSLVGLDFQLMVFSDDDVPHLTRLHAQLANAGHSVSSVDCRGLGFSRLCYLFKGIDLLVTTRFHALVIALLCQTRVLAADQPGGKKHRLLKKLGVADSAYLLTGSHGPGFETMGAAAFANALSGHVLGFLAATDDLLQLAAAAGKTEAVVSQTLKIMFKNRRIAKVPPIQPNPSLLELVDGQAHVRLCWAASSPETEGFGNLGDSLSAVMVSALSGLPVVHTNFDAAGDKLVAVGSVAHAIKGGRAILWGPGVSIRGGTLADNVKVTEYDVRALRGAISASHLRGFGINAPACYGDPVWLLPSIFTEPVEKKYELGVIPHLLDLEGYGPDAPPKVDSTRYKVPPEWQDRVAVINTWHEPTWEGILKKLRIILSCKRILSQSFHGVVIAEAYGIPVLNFRHLPGKTTGVVRFSTVEECTTDPRIYEYYQAAGASTFPTYAQRRDSPTDWAHVIAAIDSSWMPLTADLGPLVKSFPLPLAYDPLSAQCTHFDNIQKIRF